MALWSSLLEDEDLAQSLRDYLSRATTGRLTCYPESSSLYIFIQGAGFPFPEDYDFLSRSLSQLYPDDVDLTLIPCLAPDAAMQAVPEDLFLRVLNKISPLFRRWRLGIRWQLEEAEARIVCKQALVKSQLDKKRFVDSCQRLWQSMTTQPMSFQLTLDSQFEKDSHAEILESIAPKTVTMAALPKGSSADQASSTCTNDLLVGKAFHGNCQNMEDILEEDNGVILQGEVFSVEKRELKSGRLLFLIDLTDQSDSISCKYFATPEEAEKLERSIQNGDHLRVKGRLRTDDFSGELTMMVQAIMKTSCPTRCDNADVKRVELHLHTKMSPLDGVSSLDSLLRLAKEMGHEQIAITDHGVVQAFPEAYELGKKYGLKIIYGMEAYIFDDSIPESERPRSYHCVLLAKNKKGLENLYKLVTESHLRYFKRRPRIPKRLLAYAREGLVLGSACEAGELIQHYLAHPQDDDGLRALAEFYDYIEIQPIANNSFMIDKGICKDEEELRQINRRLWELGQEVDKPVVATCDVHFGNEEEAIYRGIIMAGHGFTDAEDQAPLFYRNTAEMLDCFAYLGKEEAYEAVVTNPRAIVADFEDLKPMPDGLHAPYIEGAEEEIVSLTMEKAHALYGNPLPEIVEARITKELDAIVSNDFSVLYLISHKLVKKSLEDGYLVGSRGSVGSSLVAYLTDITEVNALPPHYRCPNCQHVDFAEGGVYGCGADMPDAECPACGSPLFKDGFDIPFEIFLGFKGDKVPDIDLNFSGDYQARAHAYTEELFGTDQVFRAGTISTIASKTAFGYVSKFYEERGVRKRRAEVNRLCLGCSGVKRTTGQHPGGLMVIPQGKDVHCFTPLQRPADDVKSEIITTHFDYHSISERLVKLDVLGHDDPTVIRMLEDLTGVDAAALPLDDPATLSLFSSVEAIGGDEEALRTPVGTYGIPEFNTAFVRKMLQETQPSCFADLLRISGYSHGTNVWLNNAQDLIRSGKADVSETISTRDDIMLYLTQKTMPEADAFGIMERVRKGRGLTEKEEEGMREYRIPEWFVDSCKKIAYLFPKAHAVAYVMMAFRIAWFKINHPLAFYASYFTVRGILDFDCETVLGGQAAVRAKIDGLYEEANRRPHRRMTAKESRQVTVLEVALELYVRGYEFLPVSQEHSQAKSFSIEEGKLRIPLMGIPGLGQTMAEQIVAAREQEKFISIEDLKIRGKVGDSMVEAMQRLNALGDLPESNQIPLF